MIHSHEIFTVFEWDTLLSIFGFLFCMLNRAEIFLVCCPITSFCPSFKIYKYFSYLIWILISILLFNKEYLVIFANEQLILYINFLKKLENWAFISFYINLLFIQLKLKATTSKKTLFSSEEFQCRVYTHSKYL